MYVRVYHVHEDILCALLSILCKPEHIVRLCHARRCVSGVLCASDYVSLDYTTGIKVHRARYVNHVCVVCALKNIMCITEYRVR